MENNGYSGKIRQEKTIYIQLVRSYDALQRPFYAYISLFGNKAAQLANAVAQGKAVELEQYGRIIASGFGHTPPLLIQQKMFDEYGILTEQSG